MKKLSEVVQKTAEKIKRLEIQGARNTAVAALEAIKSLAEETKAASRENFLNELHLARDALFRSRETEPLMRNAVRLIISEVEHSKENEVSNLSILVASAANEFLKDLESSKKRIAEIGSRRIKNNMVVFTHCHSSTVTNLLGQAKKAGKIFEVICTETRPAFQGRITAKEMVALGVKTTFIVDSAARSFISQADIVLVGADAMTSEGNVVNKIGTGTIALLAHEARKPFYIVSELLKFDPETLYGGCEKIEERSTSEIWQNAPEQLMVRNPAFDVTPRDLIHGVICEEGVVSPHLLLEVVRRNYPWIFVEYGS